MENGFGKFQGLRHFSGKIPDILFIDQIWHFPVFY